MRFWNLMLAFPISCNLHRLKSSPILMRWMSSGQSLRDDGLYDAFCWSVSKIPASPKGCIACSSPCNAELRFPNDIKIVECKIQWKISVGQVFEPLRGRISPCEHSTHWNGASRRRPTAVPHFLVRPTKLVCSVLLFVNPSREARGSSRESIFHLDNICQFCDVHKIEGSVKCHHIRTCNPRSFVDGWTFGNNDHLFANSAFLHRNMSQISFNQDEAKSVPHEIERSQL
jgi:hypothetical protein